MASLPHFLFAQSTKPRWLGRHVFGSVVVLQVAGDKLNHLDGAKTEFCYHPEIGVWMERASFKTVGEGDDEFSW
ncbi:MAG TPA: hypothetical protein DCZ95_06110 [Verrucomicrobia bacterium]|nr:MAG: hypothetical protein A2X46_13225 [Lentisphaerae bacterium GWF2_57_35]HBA83652.1 hypothetical protein [Verrucomicrobiota bacterium]